MFEESVSQIMTPHVVSIKPSDTVYDALSLMFEKKISFIVVSSNDNFPIGVITERDIINTNSKPDYRGIKADSIMSSPVMTVKNNDTAFSALRKLAINNIRHLVVVNESGKTSGILTLTDFLQRLGFEYFIGIKEVSDVMGSNMPTLSPGDKVQDAISSMDEIGAECAVILDNKALVGIFTERDVISASYKGIDPSLTNIKDIMTQPVFSVFADTHLLEALSVMQKKGIRHLPVVDAAGQIKGLVSQSGIVKGMELKYTGFVKSIIVNHEKELLKVNAQLEEKVQVRTKELDDKNLQLKKEVAKHKRTAKTLEKSREELRRLTLHLQEVREEERSRIARDIHDELGQMLSIFKLDLLWINKRLRKDEAPILSKIENLSDMADSAIDSVQRITSELRPPLLDDLGFVPVINWLTGNFSERSGIGCELLIKPENIILDNKMSIAVFRIIQESLTNIMRHSEATKAKVLISYSKKLLNVLIEDNGRGISNDELLALDSFGLMGMKERLYPWNGTIRIKTGLNGGTTVSVTIPLDV